MKNLYQTWTIGGSGYAVLQDKLIVRNRMLNNDSVIEDNDKEDNDKEDKLVIDATGKANGVYVITAEGELIAPNDAAVDATCLGVALIVNDAPTPQRLMIEKNGEANTTSIKAAYEADGATDTWYTNFYWGPYGTDVSGITNWTDYDGATIPTDYTTWSTNSTYVWNDFNGKSNTAALLNVTDSDSNTNYANAATYCKNFNETATENQGYTDWYIPACGQLSLIYINVTEINAALTKIGGTTLKTSYYYWSSSEYSSDRGWLVTFVKGLISWHSKNGGYQVRLVRDI